MDNKIEVLLTQKNVIHCFFSITMFTCLSLFIVMFFEVCVLWYIKVSQSITQTLLLSNKLNKYKQNTLKNNI